jgi:hypothetical protein|eukprot:COSAG01_NODE_139_length_24311_cov_75.405873_21_plen_119_part_00
MQLGGGIDGLHRAQPGSRTACVPDRYLRYDVVVATNALRPVIHTHCWLVGRVERSLRESVHQARFPHAAVTDEDRLDPHELLAATTGARRHEANPMQCAHWVVDGPACTSPAPPTWSR